MKKIIAAFLSALVGVFGYTLTDTVVEERISKLEAEIVELRSEASSGSQTNDFVNSLEVGDYIKLSPACYDKFLIRENEEGELEFIRPYNIDSIEEDDIFIYLTDVSCQVTGFETLSKNYEFGINYNPDSWEIKMPVLSVRCSGYTDSSLAGKQLEFATGVGAMNVLEFPANSFDSSKTTCVVSSDGSFSFSSDFSIKDILMIGNILNNFDAFDAVYYIVGSEYIENNVIYTDEFFGPGFGVYRVTIT